MTVPLYVAAVFGILLVASLAVSTEATRRYLHWRSRSRQLVAALEMADAERLDERKARQQAERLIVDLSKERDFYRDTARSKAPLRSRLGLTEVRGDPRDRSSGGLHVPGRG